jgi:hypothetical protein
MERHIEKVLHIVVDDMRIKLDSLIGRYDLIR